jgi:chaperone required for assembly of F1-ATPase
MEHPLVAPSQHTALMIAAEWEMQQPYVRPDSMPIVHSSPQVRLCISSPLLRFVPLLQTRLATTVIDRLIEGKPEIRHALILELLEYIETDTVW